METIKIPEERVSVLIGENGKTKKSIEKKCNVELHIEKEGDVEIIGESMEIFFAKDVVKAIGRGFAPWDAMKLAKDNMQLSIINLREFVKNESAITRTRARVIGEKGKMKMEIENATDSIISVYGYTVGIIAPLDTLEYAQNAIMKIIDGARLQNVSTYLSKIRKQIMISRLR